MPKFDFSIDMTADELREMEGRVPEMVSQIRESVLEDDQPDRPVDTGQFRVPSYREPDWPDEGDFEGDT